MGHKRIKVKSVTADFIKVKTTPTAFTFYRVEHYSLCRSFSLEIVAHIAFTIKRAGIISFSNNNNNISNKRRKKNQVLWVSTCTRF